MTRLSKLNNTKPVANDHHFSTISMAAVKSLEYQYLVNQFPKYCNAKNITG